MTTKNKPLPRSSRLELHGEEMLAALKLALEYWAHRQQRYNNRRPVWVTAAEDVIAKVEGHG